MRLEPFHLGPNLSLDVQWNGRMGTAMRKRYWSIEPRQSDEAPSQLRKEYDQWEAIRDAAYDQIKLFYALTGGYPVMGDELHGLVREPNNYYPGLHITKRILYAIAGSEIQLIYEVEAETIGIEELEEYQEGDLLDDED